VDRYKIVPISRERGLWKLGREHDYGELVPALARAQIMAMVYGGCVVLENDATGVREPAVIAQMGAVPVYWL
jgi:hypothetical protein